MQSIIDPAYYELTFSTKSRGYKEYFRIYVELNDEEKDSLRTGGEQELKTREIVESAGILDLLPEEIDVDWTHYGRFMSRNSKPSWDSGIEPIRGNNGRMVWILNEA